MEPTWDLSIPSPVRCQEMLGNPVRNSTSNNNATPGRNNVGVLENTFCVVEPITPMCLKMNEGLDDQSPQSSNLVSKLNGSSSCSLPKSPASEGLHSLSKYTPNVTRASRHVDIPKIFIPTKNCSAADLHELELTVIATIEKNRETYVCMHDVSDFVVKKISSKGVRIQWKHYDERTFYFSLPDKVMRDKFLQANSEVLVGDAIVTFKPWKPAVGIVKKPCRFKVWLRLTGLPVEHFCHNTAERVVSTFGRVHRCNIEKKMTYIGCFYVMIDCPDIDEIKEQVLVQTDNDSEIPVFVHKLYACALDVYNSQPFHGQNIPYDDILSLLLDRGKLIAM